MDWKRIVASTQKGKRKRRGPIATSTSTVAAVTKNLLSISAPLICCWSCILHWSGTRHAVIILLGNVGVPGLEVMMLGRLPFIWKMFLAGFWNTHLPKVGIWRMVLMSVLGCFFSLYQFANGSHTKKWWIFVWPFWEAQKISLYLSE